MATLFVYFVLVFILLDFFLGFSINVRNLDQSMHDYKKKLKGSDHRKFLKSFLQFEIWCSL